MENVVFYCNYIAFCIFECILGKGGLNKKIWCKFSMWRRKNCNNFAAFFGNLQDKSVDVCYNKESWES